MDSLDIDKRGQFVELHIPDFDRVEKRGGIGGAGNLRYYFYRGRKVIGEYLPRSFSGTLDFGTLTIFSPPLEESRLEEAWTVGGSDLSEEVFTMSVGKVMDRRIKEAIK